MNQSIHAEKIERVLVCRNAEIFQMHYFTNKMWDKMCILQFIILTVSTLYTKNNKWFWSHKTVGFLSFQSISWVTFSHHVLSFKIALFSPSISKETKNDLLEQVTSFEKPTHFKLVINFVNISYETLYASNFGGIVYKCVVYVLRFTDVHSPYTCITERIVEF